jgi:carboxypeptidase PM20D1
MKTACLIVLAAFIALIGAVAIRTAAVGFGASSDGAPAGGAVYQGEAIAGRLGRAIQFETISWSADREPDLEAFAGFRAFLENAYPATHAVMRRKIINGRSLIFHWKSPHAEQPPIALLAHMDVVPVEPGTEGDWTRPPFSGDVHDGAVWGRGALDNKGQIIAIMEAVERLAQERFSPSRDIYVLLGHDEELGGEGGAGEIAKFLAMEGVHFAWTLDEGSGLAQGVAPGVEQPVALIANAEKGYLTLRISATAPGGHSSAPGADTAVSLVSRAVTAIADKPYPKKIDSNVIAFLHAVAPQAPMRQRAAFANMWLTRPFVKNRLARERAFAAALHTTTAPTIITGGTKANLLPQKASALVNYRIHPRDSLAAVRERAAQLIDDERITLEVVEGLDPSPQSSTVSEGYRVIEESVAAIFGNAPTAPFLTLQATDTRHYIPLADDAYRFTPFIYASDDLERIHGTDERVKIDDLARAAAWYETLLRKTAGPTP